VCANLPVRLCPKNLNRSLSGEKNGKLKGFARKITLLHVCADDCIYLLKDNESGLRSGWACESRKSKGEKL
jgi:hypothetical protein